MWLPENIPQIEPDSTPQADLYQALVVGLRDYVGKNGFSDVIIGLSGGIDSALTSAIAVDTLGAGRVRAFMLPSPYTSRISLADARKTAANLGIRYDVLRITPLMHGVDRALNPLFTGLATDVTEENIQSRLRGLLLMAISNKFRALLLTTGNKSEISVGYTTLYGDSCGGFSVLKDIYKTQVYELARWRNTQAPVIPARVLDKPPSAELRANQTDQDTLPPYEILDQILHGFIEKRMSVLALAQSGFDRAVLEKVWNMLKNSEYKRRQSAPGVKVSSCAFGRDWRFPISNKY